MSRWKAFLLSLLLPLVAIPALPAGTPVEPFQLPAVGDGAPFRSEEQQGRFVALHFLLKTECPYCLRHLREYATRSAEAPGVVQVFIKPDTEEEILKWAAGAPPDITIHRDAEASLAKTLSIPDGYRFHGEVVHFPALIILNEKGEEVFRHVGTSNSDRVKFDTFLTELAVLRPDRATQHYNLVASKLALVGYDPVSYRNSEPQKGVEGDELSYRGVTYRFASAENRAAFIQNPEQYVPAYGGWCAAAMSKGEIVSVDPTNFRVRDGRLFLFFKGELGDAAPDWDQNPADLITAADAAWKNIAGE
jgi:peroxiredoxin Q/BCP